MSDARKSAFLERLSAAIRSGVFIRLTLGHPAEVGKPLRKRIIRPVRLKAGERFSVTHRFVNKDETQNLTGEELEALVQRSLGSEFLMAHLVTETEEITLELARRPRLRVQAASHPPAARQHDREKQREILPTAPWLRALGLTDANGQVRERMGDKFRQIARFTDLLGAACREAKLPAGPLELYDMGSGKGYLTFAAFDYLTTTLNRELRATGVEARPDLVKLCNSVAKESGMNGLRFEQGRIDTTALPQKVDLLLALHACDTATDDAIAAGVQTHAAVILVAPCCHKEVRRQLQTQGGALDDLLRHGLFAERHAEMLTDALRVLYLERAGYRVTVSEFVSAEHTARNVLLTAVRQPRPLSSSQRAEIDQRIAALKQGAGVKTFRLDHASLVPSKG